MPDSHLHSSPATPALLCADNAVYLPTVPDASVALTVSSPPYNVGKDYEDTLTLSAYVTSIVPVIAQLWRVTQDGGSVCWQTGNMIDCGEVIPLDVIFYPIFKQFGFKLRNRIVWHYEHGLHPRRRLANRHETILWFTKGDAYNFDVDPVRVPQKYPGKRHFKGPNRGELSGNPLGKNPGDVWIFPNVKSAHPEKTAHPAQFPVELAERCVLSMTRPGDTVLDPFAGTGTTLIAATKHGRIGIGCECRPDYVAIGLDRLSQLAAGTLAMRPMERAIMTPAGKLATPAWKASPATAPDETRVPLVNAVPSITSAVAVDLSEG